MGIFPKVWKSAYITPVFKNGDNSNLKKNCPISISSLNHWLRLICDSLFQHIVKEQNRFIKRRSIITNLFIYSDFIMSMLANCKQSNSLYIDFSKVFDKVNHKKLLDKLQLHSLHHTLQLWHKNSSSLIWKGLFKFLCKPWCATGFSSWSCTFSNFY